jgi:hypothetical protein
MEPHVTRRLSLGWFALLTLGVVMLAAAFASYHLFDFRIFFDASHRLLAGQDLYPTAAEVDARTRDYYVLPPVVAFLSVPLSYLPFAVAGALWALASVIALVAAVRLCGVTDHRCYVALLFSLPVLQTVGLGTIEPFLVLALALGWRYRDRAWLGTVPLGFAIAAKLFLWPVLLWLLLTRRLRRSAETAVAVVATLFVPWAALGFHELTWYPHMLRLLVKTEQVTSWALPSSSFGAVVLVADAAAVAALVVLSRSVDGDRRAFSAAVIACLLVSPLVWLHYYVVLVVPIAVASRRFSWLWLVLVAALWPFTESHSSLAVKLWGYGVLAAVAAVTLTRVGAAGRASVGLRAGSVSAVPSDR